MMAATHDQVRLLKLAIQTWLARPEQRDIHAAYKTLWFDGGHHLSAVFTDEYSRNRFVNTLPVRLRKNGVLTVGAHVDEP